MRRGDVYWVNLDPVLGSEVGKRRPAVVVQNEAANRTAKTVTVIPISGSVGRIYPFQVRIPAGEGGLAKESKALCEQVRTLSRSRLLSHAGTLPEARLAEIRGALERHLWL
jgi:mRNA interferase MazF